jgi:hypothetical protein
MDIKASVSSVSEPPDIIVSSVGLKLNQLALIHIPRKRNVHEIYSLNHSRN